MCCLVYSGVLKQKSEMAGGDEIYVDLCDDYNTLDTNISVMAMLHSFQWEMYNIPSSINMTGHKN